MTIFKYEIFRTHKDYLSISCYEMDSAGHWESTGGIGGECAHYDLPDSVYRKLRPFVNEIDALKVNKKPFIFKFVSCGRFARVESMGCGWVNSQGEELPDRYRGHLSY